ncbi:MAG: ABC transporter ATP-binding protein [Patescibacteria group bacterium]|nr:ABC transporter ATP-binding protein [Patescibacteria group bacterium]
MSNAVQVKNLSKSFKIPHEKLETLRGSFVSIFKRKTHETFKALDNISFSIKKGEFFGILGRNGSGKSTLLKILASIYEPDKGSVKINGQISPFLELGVGFNPELSGRDNIHLNAAILGLTPDQIKRKFDQIVAFSELERFLDQKLKNYSSGMQVRLAFSVAIHADKDILLMDEVLAVGDSNFQKKCLDEFNKYRRAGKTVILVTHDTDIVKKYCDQALLLRKGRIKTMGSARQTANEYIFQNMSDEEKRLFEQVESQENQRNQLSPGKSGWLKDIAKIKKIEFLNPKGKSQKAFQTGDDIIIRLHYQTRQPIEKPVFGVSLDAGDGTHIVGPNTQKSSRAPKLIDGSGFVDLVIKENPLNLGLYFVTAGLFNKDNTLTYDFKSKKHSFKIITIDESQDGPIKINFYWKEKQ